MGKSDKTALATGLQFLSNVRVINRNFVGDPPSLQPGKPGIEFFLEFLAARKVTFEMCEIIPGNGGREITIRATGCPEALELLGESGEGRRHDWAFRVTH